MRALGLALTLIGLLVTIVASFTGCNALFAWNGRHPVIVEALGEGVATHSFTAVGGKRYTIGVQVVFDREGLEMKDGSVVVEAEMPLVIRVRDQAKTTLAETIGFLDPSKPPNVLYGQSARPRERGPMPELVVERLLGPFTAASDAPLLVDTNLGADHVGSARILERRLVIHDDALPPSIRNAFLLASAGLVSFISGLVVVVLGWLRTRRKPRKGSGIP